MRWASLVALSACFVACEGAEIAIFAVNQGGNAGASGVSGASGLSGAAPAGAADAEAGAGPGGTGGTSGSETGGSSGEVESPCVSIADCENGYYCSKQRCEDVQGACVLRPIPDDDTSDTPVCGCDSNVYSNDTLRQAYGIAASTPGPCNSSPHTCTRDDECGQGRLCAHYLPPATQCGTPPGPGRCWITPGECPAVNTSQYQICPPPNGSGSAAPPCVSRCQAIQSGHPFMPLPQGQICP